MHETAKPLAGADCVAILTESNEFRALDLKRVKGLLKVLVMVGPCNRG